MELNKLKAVFIDIDGTIYNSNAQVTEYTKNVIYKLKEKGIYSILCSGRTNISVCNVSKEAKASKYVIGANGAIVYDYEDNIEIYSSVIEKRDVEKVWNFCEKEHFGLILEAKYKRYSNSYVYKGSTKEHIKIKNIEEIDNDKIFQMVIVNVDIKKRNIVEDMIVNEERVKIANYGFEGNKLYFFDINNKNIDKGIGIYNILKYLSIEKENTICFGDGLNDYAMFRECGLSIAMGNAQQELKDMANYITSTNDEDGVAKFIEKYILNR